MFTAQQFSQLAAAAWSGPAASIGTHSRHHQAPGGYTHLEYQVFYHIGRVMYSGSAQCPFTAVAAAVAAAAAAGVPVSRHHAQRTIARTAYALCGHTQAAGFPCRARRRRVARLRHA